MNVMDNIMIWVIYLYMHKMLSYLKGLASTRCPIVTKLVSWFDMNQAREETLQSKHEII
jgi:hypothetical protein